MDYLRHYLDVRRVTEPERLPTLDRLERDYVAYLRAVTSNVTETSRILGVSRNTVYHKSEPSRAS